MMGQNEIIAFLRNKRLQGDDSFFTVHEILKGCNGGSVHYGAVRKSLYGLVRLGIVETEKTGDIFEWIRTFRLGHKYIEEKDSLKKGHID